MTNIEKQIAIIIRKLKIGKIKDREAAIEKINKLKKQIAWTQHLSR